MTTRLNFRTDAQAALFTLELSGQISDGKWENTRPWHHWEDWSDAKVSVQPDLEGRNFHPVKDNYNFCSTDLLEVVGDRMRVYAALANIVGYATTKFLYDNSAISDVLWNGFDKPIIGFPKENHYPAERERMVNTGFTQSVIDTLNERLHVELQQYDRAALLKDLRQIKKTVRLYNKQIAD